MLRRHPTSFPATQQTAARRPDMATASATQVTPERIMQFTFGFAPPLIIEAAMRHRVFDALDEGAKTIETLCAETQTSLRGLRALLNALVGLELLAKDDGGRYALTPESAAFLVRGKPAFHGAFFLLTSERMLSEWAKLHDIVRSGRPEKHINREQGGVPFFRQFVEDIFPIHYAAAQRLGEALEVSKAAAPLSVLDLAAGSGVWSVALALQSPHVRVTAVDWPGVIPITQKVAARFGVADRFRFVAGDLLEADFGSGHAIATAGHILHSEGEARSRLLLERTFDALARQPYRATASLDFCSQHAGELGPRRYLLLARDRGLPARRRLHARAYRGRSWARALTHLGDEAEPLNLRRRPQKTATTPPRPVLRRH